MSIPGTVAILPPTLEEVRAWVLSTVQHVYHIEYFLAELGIGEYDPERPHDIVGPGNKFEWNVIRGFAVQYRDRSPEFFQAHVMPSLRHHRCQYHHRMWNEPNEQAGPEDMKLGAVDAICSLLETRQYQGGSHSFDAVLEIAERNPEHKRPWMLGLITEMRKLVRPSLDVIASLDTIPNIGVPRGVHDEIQQRVVETRSFLVAEFGYSI
jgi:hypothetical protein